MTFNIAIGSANSGIFTLQSRVQPGITLHQTTAYFSTLHQSISDETVQRSRRRSSVLLVHCIVEILSCICRCDKFCSMKMFFANCGLAQSLFPWIVTVSCNRKKQTKKIFLFFFPIEFRLKTICTTNFCIWSTQKKQKTKTWWQHCIENEKCNCHMEALSADFNIDHAQLWDGDCCCVCVFFFFNDGIAYRGYLYNLLKPIPNCEKYCNALLNRCFYPPLFLGDGFSHETSQQLISCI